MHTVVQGVNQKQNQWETQKGSRGKRLCGFSEAERHLTHIGLQDVTSEKSSNERSFDRGRVPPR